MVDFRVITIGLEAPERFDKLQAADDFSEGYFTRGSTVLTADATANYLHEHIRHELGQAEGQDKHYLCNYPLEGHKKVFELLPAEKELGMRLSATHQLISEQFTATVVVNHKNAKYYNVGE